NVEMSDEAVELSSLLATSFDRDAEDFTENINSSQRIIVAAEGFDSRMVEVISWLVNNGADICGLRYRTFMVGGQEIYFAEQVVPQTDPSVDSAERKSPSPVEAEEPWRVRQMQYYTDRLIPSVANQLEELLKLIRSHTFSIDWSHKYYFLVRGARRNLRIRTYQRNRIDIGFFNASVEAVNEFINAYSLNEFEANSIGGYEKSPFVGTTSDVEFDDRWRAALCDWLSGATPGTTTPELPPKGRSL
ncbi:MAG: hypothetical protein JXA52_07155, partial [Planctomycetes bacterium]|nr:hypothetical protein [Planctomycetota bacterium]